MRNTYGSYKTDSSTFYKMMACDFVVHNSRVVKTTLKMKKYEVLFSDRSVIGIDDVIKHHSEKHLVITTYGMFIWSIVTDVVKNIFIKLETLY